MVGEAEVAVGPEGQPDGGVVVEAEQLEPGRLVDVRVTGAGAYDLFARVEPSFDVALTGWKGTA